jgi:hypothetical protein
VAASTQSKKNEALGRRREDEGDSPEDDEAPIKRGLSFRKRAQTAEAAETEEPEQLKKRSMLQRAVEKGKAKVAEGAEERLKDEAKDVAKEALKEERKKWVI